MKTFNLGSFLQTIFFKRGFSNDGVVITCVELYNLMPVFVDGDTS